MSKPRMLTNLNPMNYIEGYCHTNLDEYRRLSWPTQFVAVPRLGERVESSEKGAYQRSLKVVGVTHAIYDGHPFIRIELNK